MSLSRELKPNEPLIAGAAQQTWPSGCPGPVEMLAAVLGEAAADAGPGRQLLERIDAICAVKYISADHPDPAALVADRLGIQPRLRLATENGGDSPSLAMGELSARIAAGDLDAAAIIGGEAMKTWTAHDRAGTSTGWNEEVGDSAPDEVLGIDRWGNSAAEMAIGLVAPIMMYPLFEHSLWSESGLDRDGLAQRLGTLQERFSAAAVENPHAWGPTGLTAQEIASPTPDNRMVSLPYTKLMNANIQTDQAAALILVSESLADELGIARGKRVYVHGSAHAVEPWNVSERTSLGRSPSLGWAVSEALGQAHSTVETIDLFDIYSCFPSAVEIAGREIGFDPLTDPRSPTLTGGLAFGGGPGNAYVIQSLAAATGQLRGLADGSALVTAVGWYLTKHGATVLGSQPPEQAFEAAAKRPEQAAERQVAEGANLGPASAETATVIYDRDGSATIGFLTALLPDGRRALRATGEPGLLAWIDSGEPVTGKPVRLDEAEGFLPL